ncbi:DUF4377 domain-containing protein [Pseudoflavitalea sp. G-6-1-2]|uniref:DUF4377 domain-containing protein n=1 Tax=Pseudoflavitalea sp. G-6-1-2 TaxID=2728841 RepID=UPI00146ED06F|nr:DUF4377 domain-containing protein [Pseudoflavitalea sp. G-6-1-2]NML21561.1 DUF4377 domain-containing protein [Pseudoflavitalea sp. G-6-1-2]
MIKKRIVTSVMLLVVFFSGISAALAGDFIKMTIKENQGDCVGVAPMKCLLVLNKKNGQWENFYDGIQNFNYKEGYRYTILVERTKRTNVPADASAYEYKLVKVLKQKIVKPAKQPAVLKSLSGTEWKLIQLNGKAIGKEGVTLKFDAGTKGYGAYAGCNRMGGGLKWNAKKGTLDFGPAMSTLMACGEDVMKLEHEYNKALSEQSFKVSVKGNKLQLIQKGKVVLEFSK